MRWAGRATITLKRTNPWAHSLLTTFDYRPTSWQETTFQTRFLTMTGKKGTPFFRLLLLTTQELLFTVVDFSLKEKPSKSYRMNSGLGSEGLPYITWPLRKMESNSILNICIKKKYASTSASRLILLHGINWHKADLIGQLARSILSRYKHNTVNR